MISIVIPAYNIGAYLNLCLNSIIAQTYKDYEVIIVDDGSTDDTLNIANRYCNNDNRISVIHIENHGVSYARNIGINKAKGDYITFIDGDDWLEEKYLEILYNNIINNHADVSVCSYFYSYDDRETRFLITESDTELIDNLTSLCQMADPHKMWVGWAWGKLYSIKIIKNYNIKYDESISICEDSLFNVMYLNHAKKIVKSNVPLYHYRIRQQSATRLANENPVKTYTKIRSFKKILSIAQEYPGSQFLDNTYRIIFSTYIYFLSIMFRMGKYERKTVIESKAYLKKIRKHVKLSKLGFNTMMKWIIILISPKLLYHILHKNDNRID